MSQQVQTTPSSPIQPADMSTFGSYPYYGVYDVAVDGFDVIVPRPSYADVVKRYLYPVPHGCILILQADGRVILRPDW